MNNRIFIPVLLFFVLGFNTLAAQTSIEMNNQGLVKYKAKNYAAALVDFNKAVELDAKNEKALHNRGLAKYALKDYEGSIADQTKAIALNAAYSNAYNDRGMVYYQAKQFNRSTE